VSDFLTRLALRATLLGESGVAPRRPVAYMPEASVAVKPETSVATTRELVAGDVFNEEAIAIAAWPGAPAEVIEIDGPAPEPYVLAPSNANPVAESWRQAAVTNPERPTADTGNVSDRLPARAASHEPDSPPTHPGPAALPSADAASASSLDREVVDGRSVNRLTEPIIPGDSPLISDDLEPVVPLAEAHTLEGKAEAHTELSPWSPGSPLVTPIPLGSIGVLRGLTALSVAAAPASRHRSEI
jgi:hypothetical protein